MLVTPCVQRAMHRFTERERERARRLALEGSAKEMSSAAPDRNVASVDVRGKQGRRSSGEPGSDSGRGQEEDSGGSFGTGSSNGSVSSQHSDAAPLDLST